MRNYLWCPHDPRGKGIDEMMRETIIIIYFIIFAVRSISFLQIPPLVCNETVTDFNGLFDNLCFAIM